MVLLLSSTVREKFFYFIVPYKTFSGYERWMRSSVNGTRSWKKGNMPWVVLFRNKFTYFDFDCRMGAKELVESDTCKKSRSGVQAYCAVVFNEYDRFAFGGSQTCVGYVKEGIDGCASGERVLSRDMEERLNFASNSLMRKHMVDFYLISGTKPM